MQDFGTKSDDTAGPSGQLSAAEFNNLASEAENAVLRSGQVLTGASVTQLATSLFLHGVKAQTFQDSGAANAYVATPVSGAGGVLLPTEYSTLNGATIIIKASASNTTASTLNIGQTTGTLLGTKAIVDQAGAPLISGAIQAGSYLQLRYDASIGAGSWVLMPWTSKQAGQPPSALNARMSIAAASTTGTMTASLVTVATALFAKSYQIQLFNKVINLATTGAGGMDTGTAPVSGYVALYAIYNPTTDVSALLAVNATGSAAPEVYGGANMPAGFTASALLTVVATNASSQFLPVLVLDRRVSFQFISAFSTSGGAAVLTSTSIAAAIPLNAKNFAGHLSLSLTGAGATTVSIAASATTTTNGMGIKFAAMAGAGGTISGQFPFNMIDLVTAQTVFYTLGTTGSAGSLSIFISSYMI